VGRFFTLFIFLFVCGVNLNAQTIPDTTIRPIDDTLVVTDTVQTEQPPVVQRIDTFSKRPGSDHSWNLEPGETSHWQQLARQVLAHHPWLGFSTEAFTQRSELKQFKGKEDFFYAIIFLLLIFALLRNASPKYFSDLFRLFFRTTLKQRQIRDQLMQTPLPSLLLNGYFIMTGGLYIALLLRHHKIDLVGNFWLTSLYCSLGLSVAYFVKFLGLKLSGWLFNMRNAAHAYIFIVFIVNKMLGILLLPFIIILAFTSGSLYNVGLNLSYCLIAVLLVYRFILTFAAVRNQVRVNPFHFFLYLCAFEIAPLLLVYKGLLVYIR
jgi:hypothetical protein